MKKIYIVTSGTDYAEAIFKEFENKKDIKVIHKLKEEKNNLINLLIKMSFSKKLSNYIPLKKIIYRSFFNEINILPNSEDTIIFFNSFQYSKRITFLKWFRKNYPKVKLYLWNWDTLKESSDIERLKSIYNKIVTFDEEDSKKFELEYFVQAFSKKLVDKYKNIKGKGVSFIGNDKGRLKFLEEIAQKLSGINIEYNFYVLKDKKIKYSEKSILKDSLYSKLLSYNELLEKTANSEIVIDLVKDGQTGFPLRVMESVFMGKKIITTNKRIKNFEFYNPNNILVIEKVEDINKEFFEKPYEAIDEKILENYTLQSWLKKIID